ncbi:MAG: hypothetical protein Unbinned4944contig1000_38 [Prokaryotic dsDNA virus sp.]|nr:MAG: hypothetical protein Unbinned4944contig1000_38 [Prokaryotic dsDNA virus sp.]|tara:strand:- start:214 stop:756 length:543 start_codon:yes stop_codon:yes gene_type:complete
MTMKIPYQVGSDTSRAAAESQKAKAPATIERIYRFLLACGQTGATDDEIKKGLGLLASTAGARRRDLEMMGGCMKSKRRRVTSNGGLATVHVAIPGATLNKKKMGRPKKDKTYSEKVMTYLDPKTFGYLRELSDMTDRSVSDLVREAVSQYVRREVNLKVDGSLDRGMTQFMDYLHGGER